MWNPQTMELMPGFWPPRASGFWGAALEPLRRYYLHRSYGISAVEVIGAEHLTRLWSSENGTVGGDGVLIAPNHSHDSDPHVMMEVGHRLRRQLYFMAAWQVFLAHGGIDGWVMQRFGAFSVDREGCDRRAMRQAMDLLVGGEALVVFPEGEIYHTNERLTPLREGVAFMAVTAQRELDKHLDKHRTDSSAASSSSSSSSSPSPSPPSSPASTSSRQVWVVPTAIRYTYEQDITPQLESTMSMLESRIALRPRPGTPLPDRIIRYGEMMLTLQEKEKLGRAYDADGDLPSRLKRLIDAILERLETTHLEGTSPDESVPVRVKSLRRHLLERMCDASMPDEARREARAALDELHLVLQLYSYPGDYISTRPTVERMAETVEKFEEDLVGSARPKGKRRATVRFGEPLDVKRHSTARARAAAGELTARLENAITELMRA